jgi:hypothetical protein
MRDADTGDDVSSMPFDSPKSVSGDTTAPKGTVLASDSAASRGDGTLSATSIASLTQVEYEYDEGSEAAIVIDADVNDSGED